VKTGTAPIPELRRDSGLTAGKSIKDYKENKMVKKIIMVAVFQFCLGLNAYAQENAAQPQAQPAVQNEAAAPAVPAGPADIKPAENEKEGGIMGWWRKWRGKKEEKIATSVDKTGEPGGKIEEKGEKMPDQGGNIPELGEKREERGMQEQAGKMDLQSEKQRAKGNEKAADKLERNADRLENSGERVEDKGEKMRNQGEQAQNLGEKREKRGERIEKKGKKKQSKRSHKRGAKHKVRARVK
jgi:hypothetical protein